MNESACIDVVTLHEVDLIVGEDEESLLIEGFEQFSAKVKRRAASGVVVEKIRTITFVREGVFDEIVHMKECAGERSEVWLRLKNKGRKDIVHIGLYNEWSDGKPGLDNDELMVQVKKRMSSDIFLHGDLNIDLDRVQDNDTTYSHYKIGLDLIQEMDRCGLDRHGSGITREEWKNRDGVKVLEQSAIDWAATNIADIQHFSRRVMADFSDHEMIVSDIPYQAKGEAKVEKIRVRNINNLTTDECMRSLNHYHWEALSSMTLEEMGAFVRRVLVENLDRYAPWRWVKVKKNPGRRPTEEEKKLRSRLVKELHKGDRVQVRSLRKRLQKCLRRGRIEDFEKKVVSGKTDMWKAFKRLTKKSKSEVVIIDNNKRIVGDECANRFADYFAGKIRKLKSACTPVIPDKKTDEELRKEGIRKFEFKTLSEEEVAKIVRDSKPSTATDMYGISPKMLKLWSSRSRYLVSAITFVINNCIVDGEIPVEWKTSKLYPCYKSKGSRHQTSSYRPIALGSPLIKIFEAAVNTQLVHFMESRGYLSESQHGYRKSRSTISATAHLADRIDEARQNKLKTGIICFDYSSAFDMVDEKILGRKLHNLGFGSTSVDLMMNYMSDRSIVVEASGGKSKTIHFKSLSPQGSKISPTVYLCATHDINKIIEAVEGCYSVTYADDTNVVCTARSYGELKKLMEEVCRRIQLYSSMNGLCLNASKTEFIVVRNKITKLEEDFCIEFDGEKIKESKSVKFLGIVTARDLSGHAHIDSILSDVNRRIGMIRRLREYFSATTLLKLVKANIIPKVLYGSECWCNVTSEHEKGVLQKVELLYKEAIRAAFGYWKGNRTPSEVLWERSGIEKPGRTILRKVAVAAFDIYNDVGSWRFLRREVLFRAERERRKPYEGLLPVLPEVGSLRNRATRVHNCLPIGMKSINYGTRERTLKVFKSFFNNRAEDIEEELKNKYFERVSRPLEVSKIRSGLFREVAQTAVVVNTWQRAYSGLSRGDSVVKMSGSKVETDTELENLRRRVLELTPAPGWSRPVVVEPNVDVEPLRRRVSEMEAKAAGERKESEGDQERVNDSKEAQ